MSTQSKPIPRHGGWNRFFLILLTILLVLTCYITILRDNFNTGSKTYLFLREAKVFDNFTELAKIQIRSNLPQNIKNNIIKRAMIEKIMEIIITPENVAKIAEPAIDGLYKLSNKATTIAGETIIIDTTPYKKQANEYLPSLGLPQGLNDASNDFIGSVPDKITIIDVKNNPNSPLAVFVKLRAAYKTLSIIADILWLLILINLISLVALNIKSIPRLLSALYKSFGIAGGLIVALSYLAPPIVTSIMPQGANPAASSAITSLVADALESFMLITRGYGWTMLVIASLALLTKLLMGNDKVKSLYTSGHAKLQAKLKSNKIKS